MGRSKRGKGKKKRGSGQKKPPPQQTPILDAGGNGDGADLVCADIDNRPVDVNTPPPLGLGTRVEIRGSECSEYTTGTVTEHWVKVPGLPENVMAPYLVRLDEGTPIVVVRDFEACIRRSDAPPLKIVHDIGSRVECKLGSIEGDCLSDCDGKWFPGTITRVDEEWYERDTPPYLIRFDDGRELPFWGPLDCIRASSEALPAKQQDDLRFRLGERVACRIGPNDWVDGTVIKLWYRQRAGFADGHAVPYQIQLDSRAQIFAPHDSEECIRRSDVPPPNCWICFDNEITENNLIVRECNCRGEQNGFAHINCLVQFAQTKVEGRDPDHRLNPFEQCVTCKDTFNRRSLCAMALANAYYDAYKGRGVGDVWNRDATTHLSKLLMEDEKYLQASNLLSEQISQIRLEIGRDSKLGGNVMTEVSYWTGALASSLLTLAEVHCEMGSLSEMKVLLDESRAIQDAEGLVDVEEKTRLIKLAARHAYETGEKGAALVYMETLTLARSATGPDIDLLLQCGNLNLEFGNKELGLEQICQAAQAIESRYGRGCPLALFANKYIHRIQQGQMDQIPSKGLGVW